MAKLIKSSGASIGSKYGANKNKRYGVFNPKAFDQVRLDIYNLKPRVSAMKKSNKKKPSVSSKIKGN